MAAASATGMFWKHLVEHASGMRGRFLSSIECAAQFDTGPIHLRTPGAVFLFSRPQMDRAFGSYVKLLEAPEGV